MQARPAHQQRFQVGDSVCSRYPDGSLTNQIGVIEQAFVAARDFYKVNMDEQTYIFHATDLALVNKLHSDKE